MLTHDPLNGFTVGGLGFGIRDEHGGQGVAHERAGFHRSVQLPAQRFCTGAEFVRRARDQNGHAGFMLAPQPLLHPLKGVHGLTVGWAQRLGTGLEFWHSKDGKDGGHAAE